jgi:hypothetical protein
MTAKLSVPSPASEYDTGTTSREHRNEPQVCQTSFATACDPTVLPVRRLEPGRLPDVVDVVVWSETTETEALQAVPSTDSEAARASETATGRGRRPLGRCCIRGILPPRQPFQASAITGISDHRHQQS